MIKLIQKDNEKMIFETDMGTSLANAIRRSVNQIPTLAISEVDIYKNDSALYDEIIAHRLGLVPLKNQKLKQGDVVEMKLKVKGGANGAEVLSGELGDDVVYNEMPITLLEKDQEIELVAKASVGKGESHAKHVPGLVFYKQMPVITISKEGEKHKELADNFRDVFEFDGKLKVKNAWKSDLDNEDMENYPGVSIKLSDDLVFSIESWGQMDAKDIFTEACKALKGNLNEVSKQVK